MATKSAASSASSLPEISRANPSLVEAARKATLSPPGPSLPASDSGLGVESIPSRRSSGGGVQASGWTLKAATVPLTPRPPSPRARQPVTRRQLQFVRLARSELEHKDQALAALRSENVQLQAKTRELENMQESHTMLQSACAALAQCLGCNVEGVAADSVGNVLQSKASGIVQEYQNLQQQLRSCRCELDSARGEAAAAVVKVSSLETQLQQTRAALAGRESEAQQQRAQIEGLQQSTARTSTTLQSLRQQLAAVEEGRGRRTSESLSELHTEIGRLRSSLQKKDASLETARGQLEASQAENETMQERVANTEAMYEDLCSQLATAFQLESTDSFDVDSLTAQVCRLAQECTELRLRTETLVKTLKTCELDSKASRETILRLVSEAKKRENVAAKLSELQQAHVEQRSQLSAVEVERGSLQERLVAAKETMAAQEKELQAKQARVSELVSSCDSLKATSESEREVIESEQQKYEELCKAIAGMVGSQSTDSVELLHILEQLVQSKEQPGEEEGGEEEEEEEEEEKEAVAASLSDRTRLAELEGALEQERTKVKQLEGEVVSHSMVKEGLSSELRKEKEFYQKLSQALRLDSATAKVLAGEFARDALLGRAEQLARHETQALAEKQSAYYSAQRQLKACRQNLEHKELYVNLLQKKTASLEERVNTLSQHQTQAAGDRGKKHEKQLERARRKIAEQVDEIEQLRGANAELESLRKQCRVQGEQIAGLAVRISEVSEARSEQARQLAEARLRAQREVTSTREKRSGHEKGLLQLQQQLSQAREKEQQFNSFRQAVHRLLTDADMETSQGETPTDYDLIARLEGVAATHKKHEETVQCLGSSLQQLEQGFKTSYTDTVAILQTRA